MGLAARAGQRDCLQPYRLLHRQRHEAGDGFRASTLSADRVMFSRSRTRSDTPLEMARSTQSLVELSAMSISSSANRSAWRSRALVKLSKAFVVPHFFGGSPKKAALPIPRTALQQIPDGPQHA